MPNGEFSPSRKTERLVASPLASMPRSKTMRLALGTPAPARFITLRMIQPLIPVPSSGLGGAFVSATRTSPLGSTKSQRGWLRPAAKAATFNVGAAVGDVPAGQPFSGAMLTVVMRVSCGGGSSGLGPIPADDGSVASSPQPDRAIPAEKAAAKRI